MRWKKYKGVQVYVYSKFEIIKRSGLWEVFFDGNYIGCSSTFDGARQIAEVYG